MENKTQCKRWLSWINNRLRVLDEIEAKLHQMREIAEQVQEGNLSQSQITTLNKKFKQLEQEVNRLDEQSKNYKVY